MKTQVIIEFLIGKVLVVGMALVVVLGCYALFVRSTKRFQAMRFFLIGAMVFCFALPFLKLKANSELSQSLMMTDNLVKFFALQEFTITPEAPSVLLDEVTVNASARWGVWQVLWGLYWTGVTVAFIMLIYRLLKIFRLFRKSERKRVGKYVFVYTHRQHISFSFLNAIFLSEGENHASIVRHEQSHIDHAHSADMLLAELLIAFQWFNPAIYWCRNELKNIHEYTADHDVLESGTDKSDYMMLILQQCTAVNICTIGNSFSYKLTKRRIKMMTQKFQSKRMLWRLLASLPVAFLLLLANAKVVGQDNTSAAGFENPVLDDLLTEVLPNVPNDEPLSDYAMPLQENDSIYTIVETMPEFPGGRAKMMGFLAANISYPQAARDKGVEGRVYVSFVVNEDGSVSDVKVLRGIGGGCDEEAVRVVQSMPNWKPGTQKGKPVRVAYNLPINFKLSGKSAVKTDKKSKMEPNKDGVYAIVEQMPEFPGGQDQLLDYLISNIKYPKKAEEKGIEGRVYVSFVVNEDGSVSDVKVLRGIGGGCDEEAVRVVQSMPNWKPGVQKGKPVKVAYNLPVRFALKADK